MTDLLADKTGRPRWPAHSSRLCDRHATSTARRGALAGDRSSNRNWGTLRCRRCHGRSNRGGSPGVLSELETRVADADDVAGNQGLLGDALAVDEGAGGAVVVRHHPLIAFLQNLAVDARYVWIEKMTLSGPAASQEQRVRSKMENP